MRFHLRYLSFILLFLSPGVYGQRQPCAFDEARTEMQRAYPEQKMREEAMNARIAAWVSSHAGQPSEPGRYFPNGPDFIIPVVVHVVHNGEAVGAGTNISYAQVCSQIDALNAAFSKYSATANYYQALAGSQFGAVAPGTHAVDTRIRFCLATNPGNGVSWTSAAEPGVMRYNDPAASRHAYTAASQTQLANLTQPGGVFPSDKFLNVWVVTAIRFGGAVNSGDCPGIEGYATIAGYTGPQVRLIEGVVMRSDVFGDNFITGNSFNLQPNNNPACPNGQNNTLANRGKIFAHEVGHFLGLYHTFHECNSSVTALCSTTGDLICDTNPCDQPGAATGCGLSDMPENFMYYSDDATLNTFTIGQRDRMHGMLNTERASLVEESNVLASGVLGPNGCFAGTVMAEFTNANIICANTAIVFSNVSGSGNLANQWQWTVTPSAGVTISSPNAASTDISFPTAGTYMVELTASNSGSQVRTFQKNIQVTACQLLDCRKNQQKWIFGWGYSGVDFSSGSPATYIPPTNLLNDGNQESYYVETDPQTGNVLFYTNGSYVYDGSFNKINTTSFHPLASLGGTYNSSAQIIIIPFPGHDKQFLMFIPNRGWDQPPLVSVANNYPAHMIILIDASGPAITAVPFSCSTAVVSPGITFNYNLYAYSEQITAVPHANGRDYWILFPCLSTSGNLYMASFLLHPGGLVQKSVALVKNNTFIANIGYGLSANPQHNRIALKYQNNAFQIQLATLPFDHATGTFGTAINYNLASENIGYPGGLIFYDETHVYMSKTINFPSLGLMDVDLLTGTVSNFASTRDYGRLAYGPDGQIYVLEKFSLQGAGSQALARVDRVAGAPVVTTVIPGPQFSPNLPVNMGLNFWNLHENIHCGPAPARLDFTIERVNCNSFKFVLTDSAAWSNYTLLWDFGDGSPAVSVPSWQAQYHTYATPGTFTVTLQLSINGCLGSVNLPATPIAHPVSTVDASAPLTINGPTSVCISGQTREINYSTISSPDATYSWTVTGDAQIRVPASGIGVSNAWVLFGQTAGPRTITVQMTEGGCTVSGSVTVTGTLPGQANAGQDGAIGVCGGNQSVIDLFSLISGEQTGGYWTQISGTGGSFNAAAGTFTPAPGLTSSEFLYIIPGNTGCSYPDTSKATINVVNPAGAGFDGNTNVCQSAGGQVNLFGLITGESTGGIWERVSGTGGVFNAPAGTFDITTTATSSSFRYIISGGGSCGNDTSFALVTVDLPVNAGVDGQFNICDLQSTTSYALETWISGFQTGGVWSRISGTGGVFNSTAATFTGPFTPGISIFQYQLPGNGSCPADNATVTATVGDFNPVPDTDSIICNDRTIDLNNIYDLRPYIIIRNWQLNGQDVDNSSAVSQAGTYNIVITDGGNCFDTVHVIITKLPPVSANAGRDTIAVYNQPHQLTGSGNGSVQWTWSPATAVVSSSQVPRPVVRLTDPEYLFVLQVSNAAGCVGTDSVYIKVLKGPAYYIPTAFTPNGDGLNDVFSAISVGIRSTEWFRVYNRYGQVIFETKDPSQGWNGTFKGKQQDPGTFTWMIRGTGNNNRVIEMKGTVVLVR